VNGRDFIDGLAEHGAATAVIGGRGQALDYVALRDSVAHLADTLRALGVRVLATQLDNGPAWIVADLAALAAGIVHVPLPGFFTPAQRAHALDAAGADALLAASPAALPAGLDAQTLAIAGAPVVIGLRAAAPVPLPAGTSKITFTSGTTGQPKGVCLSAEAMLAVADGLAQAMAPLAIARHLCALPLPVLLENIAGVYAPLLTGAACIALPAEQVGLTGSSRFDRAPLESAIEDHAADSAITLPQMLRLWTGWRLSGRARGQPAPATTLKFVAVGGASVGERVIRAARAAGLPAYEGYGLSEGASVQTLNLPGADRPGSAGRALPHARLRVADDGEIEIGGPLMRGYVGQARDDGRAGSDWWPTGDLGAIDADGFVHLRGRKNNVLITGFGRNVSPEWVETALQSQPAIAQAVVLGDGEAALWGVLWPSVLAGASAARVRAAIDAAVQAANATLPDYARIADWVVATWTFSADNGLATANGRPRRAAVLAHGLALREAASSPTSNPNRGPAAPAMTTPSHPTFFQRLQAETAADRAGLISAPIIQGALRGEVSVPSYLAFLREAYHHVRHTLPLLAACRERLPARLGWMRPAFDEYIEEEAGHDEWILNDITAAGGDAQAVRVGQPGAATEVMVAYAYDTIARGNPAGFLGMVHVLEGTSVALALAAADRIQAGLGLPDSAFSYLRSHGTLDQEHTAHFERLVNAIDDPQDQAAIVHGARMFFRLYGDVFRGLPLGAGSTVAAAAGASPRPLAEAA
jgi:acyl-CoA synthetase (AMP-forming)/AMP-acid ligase II/pyrroloquinoline quinone (PQQ) biosynthesis protein C